MIKKDITELSFQEARSFFLKSQSYCNLILPAYINFDELLKKMDLKWNDCKCKIVKDGSNYNVNSSLGKLLLKPFPTSSDKVNYSIFSNKDGLYDWRKLQIINPFVYMALVNVITEECSWNTIRARFEKFRCENIECCSIPFQNDHGLPATSGENIENWWTIIEQRSLKMSMKYNYMLNTDIVNCYGSIYTHSIAWALHGIKQSKSKISKLYGDKIDAILRWSTYNQTCGIPQGSILMDFIAELILGYADRILHYKILWYNHRGNNNPIGDYKILRYRDDYRIFTHTKEDASRIAKLLTEVLSILNFKLNQQKTFITDHIIRDAIKPDKYFRIQSKEHDNSMQKQLLLIHAFSEKHPNSGSIKTMLQHFFKRLFSDDFISDYSDNDVLLALLLDIMLHNPSSYPIAVPIIGRIIEMKCLNFTDVFSIVKNKLQSVPYTEFLDIWMQRLTIKSNIFEEYNAKICKRVASDYANNSELINMWNTEWLQKDFREIIEKTPIVNKQTIEEMTVIPTPEETDVFCNQY